ncbi:MAG: hypothetical protein ABIR91_05275 [Candidatus Saccharimonadales bacterium]
MKHDNQKSIEAIGHKVLVAQDSFSVAVTGVMTAALGIAGIASIIRGRDVTFVGGDQPMTPERKVRVAVAAYAMLQTASRHVQILRSRSRTGDSQSYSLATGETPMLAMHVWNGAMQIVMMVRDLSKTGVMSRGSSLSTYGKMMQLGTLAVPVYVVASCSKQLYDRRSQWMPELRVTLLETELKAKALRFIAQDKLSTRPNYHHQRQW